MNFPNIVLVSKHPFFIPRVLTKINYETFKSKATSNIICVGPNEINWDTKSAGRIIQSSLPCKSHSGSYKEIKYDGKNFYYENINYGRLWFPWIKHFFFFFKTIRQQISHL